MFAVPCSNCVRRQRAGSCRSSGHNSDQTKPTPVQNKRTSDSANRSKPTSLGAVAGEEGVNGSAVANEPAVPTISGGQLRDEPLTSQQPALSLLPAAAQNRMFPSPQDILSASGVDSTGLLTEPNPNDENAPDGSHGTLLLDKEGRARYLGPTAGSEWLKDVRSTKDCIFDVY